MKKAKSKNCVVNALYWQTLSKLYGKSILSNNDKAEIAKILIEWVKTAKS